MEQNTRITYPGSEKIYMQGQIYPDIKVGMRKITLTPTVTIDSDGNKKFEENAPVVVYDTSGAFGDAAQTVDLKKGLPRMREPWIIKRGGVERLPEITSEYGKARLADKSLDALRFEHIQLPLRAKKGEQISQMYYAKKG
ncbi:MAG: phosphomethylpyrimidine synthase, partial [Bacteroidales bacterium]|nr:phosphomethylpyrimidine synthase [Bacteroidales bacterium]